jgi:hypothetical protein
VAAQPKVLEKNVVFIGVASGEVNECFTRKLVGATLPEPGAELGFIFLLDAAGEQEDIRPLFALGSRGHLRGARRADQ